MSRKSDVNLKRLSVVQNFSDRYRKRRQVHSFSFTSKSKTKNPIKNITSMSLPANLDKLDKKEEINVNDINNYDLGEYSKSDDNELFYSDSEDSDEFFDSDESSDDEFWESDEDNEHMFDEMAMDNYNNKLINNMDDEDLDDETFDKYLGYYKDSKKISSFYEGPIKSLATPLSPHSHNVEGECLTGQCFENEDAENGNHNNSALLMSSDLDSSLMDFSLDEREGSDLKMETVSLMEILTEHIEKTGLDLIPRAPTRADGNCWYDAIADQILLHSIPDLPTNHVDLRKAVVKFIPTLPQAKEWQIVLCEESLDSFLSRHSNPGTWTDDMGVMCQATALYVGRVINIVGTANAGHIGSAYTTLESVEGSKNLEPFTVGYLQDRHYQSLQKVVKKETPWIQSSSLSSKVNLHVGESLLKENPQDEDDFENVSEMNSIRLRYGLSSNVKITAVKSGKSRNLVKNFL